MCLRSSILLSILVLAFSACTGRVHVPEAAENRTVEYDPEAPNFDMDAVASIREGSTGVDLYLTVPTASLVFVREADRFSARYTVLVTVMQDREVVGQDDWSDTVRVTTYEATQTFEPVSLTRRMALPPGSFTVEVRLYDEEGVRQAVRRQDVTVPDPAARGAAVSGLLLRAARGGAATPIASLHVPGGYDSLQVVAELYNAPRQATATLHLVRFATDTTAAVPPFWFMPPPFSLAYMGVDYEDADTLQTSHRAVIDASERFTMEFDMPPLDEGTYASILEVQGDDAPVERRRYWTVKSPTFPRITSLREMVDALEYIAREDELEHIRSAPSADEMKRRFDAFWADRVPNREAAASLLENYYDRVEQANIRFSAHKAGWKTDRGMIYIIFGPPAYIEDFPARRDWYYYERGAILNRRLPPFVFRRSMTYGFSGLFENYVLERTEAYEEEWRRKLEDWRDGTIL